MIGQENLRRKIDALVEYGEFPRFTILIGEKGSGRSTIYKYICKKLASTSEYRMNSVKLELGVDVVRDTIESAKRNREVCVYYFPNADKMSNNAKNALLKVTEEAPHNAYFIMSICDDTSMPETLKSRAMVLHIEPYTFEELTLAAGQIENSELIVKIVDNIGEIEYFKTVDVKEFYAFCDKVFKNISTVSGVNAFKIANKLKFKENEEGYDPILFLKCLSMICFEEIMLSDNMSKAIALACVRQKCTDAIADLRRTGLKKDAIFDIWILDIRNILREI